MSNKTNDQIFDNMREKLEAGEKLTRGERELYNESEAAELEQLAWEEKCADVMNGL